jgi:hypothetical protein
MALNYRLGHVPRVRVTVIKRHGERALQRLSVTQGFYHLAKGRRPGGLSQHLEMLSKIGWAHAQLLWIPCGIGDTVVTEDRQPRPEPGPYPVSQSPHRAQSPNSQESSGRLTARSATIIS